MPPEKSAYALARYSRSPDSIFQSIEWVRAHDSQKFLESYYFQYGHASIADLGHQAVCFENISELAATEIEDEQLWDGQAKSTRYQDFSKTGFITPSEFDSHQAARYQEICRQLIAGYLEIHARVYEWLQSRHERPPQMKVEAYARNLRARAFDVARYLLFLGVPTNVGQVVSIRTLEKQIRRLKASGYAEVRRIAEQLAEACAREPGVVWDRNAKTEPVAPTLARYVDADTYRAQATADLSRWAEENLPPAPPQACERVELLRPLEETVEIAATLLYPVSHYSYRELQQMVASWSRNRRMEVIEIALRSRKQRDELLREFRSAPFIFDIVMDIGAWRDLHRHRRCQQFRQAFSGNLGYDTPAAIEEAGAGSLYRQLIESALETMRQLPSPGAHYLLPFAARGRFLFKMDFAEAEYIARLRSGVKGHFSYRQIAWDMKQKMERLEPELGRLIQATPPWVEDALQR